MSEPSSVSTPRKRGGRLRRIWAALVAGLRRLLGRPRATPLLPVGLVAVDAGQADTEGAQPHGARLPLRGDGSNLARADDYLTHLDAQLDHLSFVRWRVAQRLEAAAHETRDQEPLRAALNVVQKTIDHLRDLHERCQTATSVLKLEHLHRLFDHLRDSGRRLSPECAVEYFDKVNIAREVISRHYRSDVVRIAPNGAAIACTSGHHVQLWKTAHLNPSNPSDAEIDVDVSDSQIFAGVSDMAFSGDARFLAFLRGSRVGVIDVRLASYLGLVPGHEDLRTPANDSYAHEERHGIALSFDGARVAVCQRFGKDVTLRVWDLNRRHPEQSRLVAEIIVGSETNEYHQKHRGVCFGQDSKRLAVWHGDRILIFEITGGTLQQVRALQGRHELSELLFAPEDALVVGRIISDAVAWDWRAEALTSTLPSNVDEGATRLAIHPTGRWLAIGGNNGQIRVYATATWKEAHAVAFEKLTWRPFGLAFSGDGRWLYALEPEADKSRERFGFARYDIAGAGLSAATIAIRHAVSIAAKLCVDTTAGTTVSASEKLLAREQAIRLLRRGTAIIELWFLRASEGILHAYRQAAPARRISAFTTQILDEALTVADLLDTGDVIIAELEQERRRLRQLPALLLSHQANGLIETVREMLTADKAKTGAASLIEGARRHEPRAEELHAHACRLTGQQNAPEEIRSVAQFLLRLRTELPRAVDMLVALAAGAAADGAEPGSKTDGLAHLQLQSKIRLLLESVHAADSDQKLSALGNTSRQDDNAISGEQALMLSRAVGALLDTLNAERKRVETEMASITEAESLLG